MSFRTLNSLCSILGLVAVLAVAPASAGVWDVEYTFAGDGMGAPQSFVSTTSPLGTDLDPLFGRIIVQYDAVSTAAPITGARVISGFTNLSVNQLGGFVITGMSHTDFLPGTGGTPGTIGDGIGDLGVDEILFSPIADSALTGFIHCTNGTFPCSFGGFTQSVNVPQTPTGPGPFPVTLNEWIFTSGSAGVGRWSSPAIIQNLVVMGQAVTVRTNYFGREISRVFTPEPGATLMALSALVTLAATARLRRR